MPAIEFVLDGDAELRQVEAALVAAEANHQGELIAELHHRLMDIDGVNGVLANFPALLVVTQDVTVWFLDDEAMSKTDDA